MSDEESRQPLQPGEKTGQEDHSRLASLAACGVVLVLILAGLWLSGILGHAGSIQDCLAAGRSNCAPVATGRS